MYNLRTPWFDDYLKDRTQCIEIYDKLSKQEDINYGVPQGSLLGPILFIICMTEIKNLTDNFQRPNIDCTVVACMILMYQRIR